MAESVQSFETGWALHVASCASPGRGIRIAPSSNGQSMTRAIEPARTPIRHGTIAPAGVVSCSETCTPNSLVDS
ncbi:hypothetical protein [Bradyrhizobium uaiense]|uniref:hypothetical protein n=1 Tax=Bradyrhizobium uaiense TaxID=2594946 RepID=UPI0013D71004|nr:hypothetical protein [Bradyrhizobium uaiense]